MFSERARWPGRWRRRARLHDVPLTTGAVIRGPHRDRYMLCCPPAGPKFGWCGRRYVVPSGHARRAPTRLANARLAAQELVRLRVRRLAIYALDVRPGVGGAPKTRTAGSAAVVEGHLVAVGVGERESAAERPVDGC